MEKMDRGGTYEGQVPAGAGPTEFGKPLSEMPDALSGFSNRHENLGERTGFVTAGYLDKNGTSYGEAAKFNYLPPGMDIAAQANAEIHNMPMRKLLPYSYPGDGW